MNDDHLIQLYLEGKLSPVEMDRTLERIKTDAAFADEVAQFEISYTLVEEYGRLDLKKKLISYSKSDRAGLKKSKTWSTRRMIQIAASVIIIAGTMLIWGPWRSDSAETIYDQYLASYTSPLNLRGQADNDTRTTAFTLYRDERYVDAARSFGEISHPTDVDRLYHAISLLLSQDVDRSLTEELLIKVISGDNDYQSIAKWYLSLMYVRSHDYEAAEDLLEQVKDSGDNFKQKEAGEVLERLGVMMSR